MYEFGHGVPQDYAEATKWYRRAAERGDSDANFNLGLMYEKGQGVPHDYAEAAKAQDLDLFPAFSHVAKAYSV
jgi:TPR repeat protein